MVYSNDQVASTKGKESGFVKGISHSKSLSLDGGSVIQQHKWSSSKQVLFSSLHSSRRAQRMDIDSVFEMAINQCHPLTSEWPGKSVWIYQICRHPLQFCWWSQIQLVEWCACSCQNGILCLVQANAYDNWLMSSNQESVMLAGIGKWWMASRYFLHGLAFWGVILNPANSMALTPKTLVVNGNAMVSTEVKPINCLEEALG